MSDASSSVDVYRTMRLQRLGSLVIVQGFEGDKMVGHTLTCDLRTGALSYVQHHPLDRDYTTIVGIVGVYRMYHSTVLVVIDKAEEVCCPGCKSVFGACVLIVRGSGSILIIHMHTHATHACCQVGMLRGEPVYKVTAVRLLASLTAEEDDDQKYVCAGEHV